MSLNFEDDNCVITTPNNTINFSYMTFERVGTGPKGIYLYQSVNKALPIPNRAFHSDAERAGFLAFIKSKFNTGER